MIYRTLSILSRYGNRFGSSDYHHSSTTGNEVDYAEPRAHYRNKNIQRNYVNFVDLDSYTSRQMNENDRYQNDKITGKRGYEQMHPYTQEDIYEPKENSYDPSKASTSQFSFYDDDITDIEQSVLGHITNAAFTHKHFYNDEGNYDDDINHPFTPTRWSEKQMDRVYHDDKESDDDDYNHYDNYEPKTKYGTHNYYKNVNHENHPTPKQVPYHRPYRSKYYNSDEKYQEYGRRQPYDHKRRYVEDNSVRPEYRFPLNSGYHYPDQDQYYDDKPDPKPSVMENLKENLPWPLNMVGRMGEGLESENDKEYPDSIQSILKNMDEDDAKNHNTYVEDHSEYPFLREEERRSEMSNSQRYNPYEEPQYNIYENDYKENQI